MGPFFSSTPSLVCQFAVCHLVISSGGFRSGAPVPQPGKDQGGLDQDRHQGGGGGVQVRLCFNSITLFILINDLIFCNHRDGMASTYPEPTDKEAYIRTLLYNYNYDGQTNLPNTWSH